MKAVITRPEEDAEPLRSTLARLGFEPVLAPLMTIEPVDGPPLDLAGVQAIAFTSANGIRTYLTRQGPDERATARPAFCVGPATAALARQARFVLVDEAAGSVDDLADRLIAACDAGAGPIVHAAGATLAGDLAGRLAKAGFTVRRETLYRAEAAETLPEAFAEVLKAPSDDDLRGLVLFFSPRTARIAADLIAKADLALETRHFAALCLSPAVGEAAGVLPWARLEAAETPSNDAMAALAHALMKS